MMEYLESTKGRQKLDWQWEIIKSMDSKSSKFLFYLDTEFADNYLIEVAIVNAAGEEVINTLVMHDKPWKQIYNEAEEKSTVRFLMDLQKSKFSWDSDWNFQQGATVMNVSQVATILRTAQCSSPEAKFVKYSKGGCDLRKL